MTDAQRQKLRAEFTEKTGLPAYISDPDLNRETPGEEYNLWLEENFAECREGFQKNFDFLSPLGFKNEQNKKQTDERTTEA